MPDGEVKRFNMIKIAIQLKKKKNKNLNFWKYVSHNNFCGKDAE